MAAIAAPLVAPAVGIVGDAIVATLSVVCGMGIFTSFPIVVKSAVELGVAAGSLLGGTAATGAAAGAAAGAAGAAGAAAGTAAGTAGVAAAGSAAGSAAATAAGAAAGTIGAPVLVPVAVLVSAGAYLATSSPKEGKSDKRQERDEKAQGATAPKDATHLGQGPNAPPNLTAPPNEPWEPEPENEKNKKPKLSNRKRKKILIDRKTLLRLLSSQGRQIYERLIKVTPDQLRNIWTDPKGDFRIDPGARSTVNPNIKTWNLQVNKKAQSNAARELKKKYGTHKKLIWGEIDTTNLPSYETWALEILERLI